MAVELGLRERKKARTRRQIYEAAHVLFAKHGFERVTVAAVAQAAEVSEPTVFSYFPTKEDLFFGGLETFEEHLVEGVANRELGTSASESFLNLLLESSARLEDPENRTVIGAAAALIAQSPSLQVREREIVAHHTRELARVLAQEMGSELEVIEAFAVANALMGLHRALVEHVRDLVLAGDQGKGLAAEFRRLARRALSRLESGLAGYAIKRG